MPKHVIEIDENLVAKLRESLNDGPITKFDDTGAPIRSFLLLTEATVDTYKGLKIEIFSNEHPPPHFRVKSQNMTGNFSIENCEVINCDQKLLKYRKNIEKWWKDHKPELIEAWNRRRPTDCTVGRYKE